MTDKNWSNLKNQSPKKVDEKVEDKTVDEADLEAEETEAKAEEETAEEEVVETKAEKKAREKAEAKTKKEAEAEAEEEVDEDDYIYFVNSNTKNLSTMVGDFTNGLFIAKTSAQAEGIRKTEDFQWGFIKEMSKKEFKKSQE